MDEFAESARDGLRDLQSEWADLNDQQIQVLQLEQQTERLEIEQQLAEAKRNANTEEIAALEEQLVLLDQIHQLQLDQLAATEAEQALKDYEAAQSEAERRAALSETEQQYEDTITGLKDQLADALVAQDQALQESIIAQIEAENARHDLVMADIEAESAAKAAAASASAAENDAGTTTTTATTQTVRTVDVRLTAPDGTRETITVVEGDEDALVNFLQSLETSAAVAA